MKSLIPAFPSVTFHNHISIVTGLYPEHHGIVDNGFYDPARKELYDLGDQVRDGSWYRAKPLWVVAEEQKVKSASLFWPTGDAEILGVRPWKLYDIKLPNEQRVAQKVEGFVNIGGLADFKKLKVYDAGVFTLLYAPNAQIAEQTYVALKGKSPNFGVYRRNETPARWHFSADPRIGDLVVIVRGPNMIGTEPPAGGVLPFVGEHGFDPAGFPTMNGIFYAVGPNVKPAVELAALENVHIFPFITKILRLENPPGLDGSQAGSERGTATS